MKSENLKQNKTKREVGDYKIYNLKFKIINFFEFRCYGNC